MKSPSRIKRIPLCKSDVGCISLERDIRRERVGAWTRKPEPCFPGGVRMAFRKLGRNPVLERATRCADIFMESLYSLSSLPSAKAVVFDSHPAEIIHPEPSREEAEKYTAELIDSFAQNRGMRELLEDARYFAGASTLGGAVGVRRARAQIKRFEP